MLFRSLKHARLPSSLQPPSCQLVPSLDRTHLTRAVTTIQFCISENAPPTLCSLARWKTQKRPNPKLRNARLPSSLQRPSRQLVPSLDRTNLTRAVTTIQLCMSENAPPTLCSLSRWKTQKRPNPKLKNARLPLLAPTTKLSARSKS